MAETRARPHSQARRPLFWSRLQQRWAVWIATPLGDVVATLIAALAMFAILTGIGVAAVLLFDLARAVLASMAAGG